MNPATERAASMCDLLVRAHWTPDRQPLPGLNPVDSLESPGGEPGTGPAGPVCCA